LKVPWVQVCNVALRDACWLIFVFLGLLMRWKNKNVLGNAFAIVVVSV